MWGTYLAYARPCGSVTGPPLTHQTRNAMPFARGVNVIGLGYIGLPTAAVLATHGVRVHGVDVNPQTVAAIQDGQVPFLEPELAAAVAGAVSMEALTASDTPGPADAHVIAVPTPLESNQAPDTTFVRAAADALAPVLARGDLVILESTSPPGTTKWLNEHLQGLRPDLAFPCGASSIPDIHVAYCPERVLPGKIMLEISTNDRIIGGLTPACSSRAAELYSLITHAALHRTTAVVAEIVKLAENAFRDVNLAFANELSIVCDEFDSDVWEVIRLANRHPRVSILSPGPGVGGHCIAIDPWFLIDAAPDSTSLMRTARRVNDEKPAWVLQKIDEALSLEGRHTVACLGLTFKADVDDLRESPALEIVTRLSQRSGLPLLIVEPRLRELPPGLRREGIRLSSVEHALKVADIVVVLVDHREFRGLPLSSLTDAIIIDTRGITT